MQGEGIPYSIFSPTMFTEAQLREQDSELQPFTAADRKLMGASGDTLHQNGGAHIHGRISADVDQKFQRLHRRVSLVTHKVWDLPSGKMTERFLGLLAGLWRGA